MLKNPQTSWNASSIGAAVASLLLTVGCSTVSAPEEGRYDDLLGTWEGAVHTPVGDLPVAFYISEAGEGLSCVLDSPNQSNVTIPCGDITVSDSVVRIVLPRVDASYRATLEADQLRGEWTQAGLNFHLQLSRLH